MLELAILGLLKEQEQHGYQLKKRLSETLGLTSGVSFGSLYPALARLERAGAVIAVEPTGRDREPIPLTGSLGGELAALRARRAVARGRRARKVYSITPRGEALFEELLAADSRPVEDDKLFHLRLAFARYMPPEARLGLLERRRAYLSERLARLRERVTAGRGRLDGYAASVIEHDHEVVERDLSWIERMIRSERRLATVPPAGGRAGQARPAGHRASRRVAVQGEAASQAAPRGASAPAAGSRSLALAAARPSISGLAPPAESLAYRDPAEKNSKEEQGI